MTQSALHITTYNIHKGFSQFNRRMMVHELRERLRGLNPDIVFLQEVQGLHLGHAENHDDWPDSPQHEFLAEDVWEASAYGRNMLYDHGHHRIENQSLYRRTQAVPGAKNMTPSTPRWRG